MIMGFALTIFAAVLGLLIFKNPPVNGTHLDLSVYIGSSVLTLILVLLYSYNLLLSKMMRIYSTYLKVTASSTWEDDWKLYRAKLKITYSKGLAIFFLILILLSLSYPLFFSIIYHLEINAYWKIIIPVFGIDVVGLLYLIEVCDILHFENKAEKHWIELDQSEINSVQ